jgi:hypothetical protein
VSVKEAVDMDREAKRNLAFVAIALWDSVLIGDPPPAVLARYERMRSPQPGDLVMETSTIRSLCRDLADDRWDGQFIPYVRSEMREHAYEDGETWSETVAICLNADGNEFAWTNADLVAVPDRWPWPEGDPRG